MDYAALHALNGFVTAHPLLAHAATLLATWIVPLVVAVTLVPWLASGVGVDARKRATAGALVAAGIAMGVNQVVIALWQRPRPYAAHPGSIVPLAGISSDPSFPSDHAAAAFAIAVAAFLAYRRAGRVLLGLALVVGASRLLVGAHYPTDVVAGALVGTVSAFVAMRLDAVWLPVVRAVARLTDPIASRARTVPVGGAFLADGAWRSRVVLVAGLAVGVRFAFAMRHGLLDEMPLALLAIWAACVVVAARFARGRAPAAPRVLH